MMVVLTFSREADMTADAVRNSGSLHAPPGSRAFFEYESTNGMPDIVFARFDEQACAARSAGPLGASFCERADVAVLLGLEPAMPRTVPELAALTRLSPSTVRSRLRMLGSVDAALRSTRSGWIRAGAFPCRLKAATAVELKLADWRKALDQAARYRSFAECSLVVVDARHAAAASEHADVFAFNGIGLAELSPFGAVTEIVPPAFSRELDPVARWVAGERLWSGTGVLAGAEALPHATIALTA